MKKILAIVLSAAALLLTACGLRLKDRLGGQRFRRQRLLCLRRELLRLLRQRLVRQRGLKIISDRAPEQTMLQGFPV